MDKAIVCIIPKEYLPKKYEEEIIDFWETNNIYEKTKSKLVGKPKFYFLDGPPYVTNPPHVGTAWNKTLKDVVIRFKRMQGYEVKDQPGYDCHGLPIEVKVEEELNIRSKKEIEEKIGIEKFIEKCKSYAIENIEKQTTIFKNLGIWMDWKNPYVTYKNDYIEAIWWTIKVANEKGLLKKGLKVIHWCPRCETALAGYEVTDEYRLIKDNSVYVKFPLKNKEKEFILVWTTTPWTLPANLAIMVNPNATYVKAKVDDEIYILAEERCEPVFNEIMKSYEIVSRFIGKELEGLEYIPPLLDEVTIQSKVKELSSAKNVHRVILSEEFVSTKEGTGCVHVAPGHGEEDFIVGIKYDLPVICPVNSFGVFIEEAGKYFGKKINDANPEIIEDLKKKNLLLYSTLIEHPYPHCWRCKTPLILRATEQWFLSVTSFKHRLLEENEKILWVPEWAGAKRFKDWLLGARDWVISRQRYWGAPLPIWICEKCGNKKVIGSIEELKNEAINFPESIDLHRHCVDKIFLKCFCGGIMKRVPDIIDVWVDSGVASWASLNYPKKIYEFKKFWPADLIIEAHDQTRGWFYSQLGAGVLAFDSTPYKGVMMHGHTLDELGQKMSKSLGNFISPEDAIAKYGRDALRFYELQCTLWEDFRFSWNALEDVFRSIKIAWNVFSFASLYMNLDKFSPNDWSLEKLWDSLRIEDKWLISKIESLKFFVTNSMENYQIHLAARALNNFMINELSHWYIRLVRRRFWQEKTSIDKIASYATIYYVLRNWIILAAPFMPFLTEKIYQTMIKPAEPFSEESIHMEKWPTLNSKWIDKDLEDRMEIVKEIIAATTGARQAKKIKLRQPVSQIIVVSDFPIIKDIIKSFEHIIIEQANTKSIEVFTLNEEKKLKKIMPIPSYHSLGPIFKAKTEEIANCIKKLDGKTILESFRINGYYELKINDESYKILPKMVSFKEEMPEDFSVGDFSKGRVYVNTRISEELIKEGFIREVVRRLQEMRKRMDLPVEAYVSAYIDIASDKERSWLISNKDYIKEEVRIKKLIIPRKKKIKQKMDLEEEWDIDGKICKMGIKVQNV
ncbi:MAG: isoleucine--tRNA ligase [Candidatus Bathyarchaeia archaeon]